MPFDKNKIVDVYSCLECGAEWSPGEFGRSRLCPDCGGKLEFVSTRLMEPEGSKDEEAGSKDAADE
jgi:DNA-directed RNA polymerase subunit RPC12/RpoP